MGSFNPCARVCKLYRINQVRRQLKSARSDSTRLVKGLQSGIVRASSISMNKWIAVLLLAAGTSFAQISVGIRIGPPPPPRYYVVPVSPGPEYVWVDGYWYADGGRYRWHNPYWTRPPYSGARWIGPRHDGERFYGGYWDGDRGRFEHDHHWDRDHRRRDWRDH